MTQKFINEKQFTAFQISKIIMLGLVRGLGLAGVGAASLGGISSTIIDISSAKSYFSAYLSIQIGANVSQCVIVQGKETIDVPLGK